MSSTPLKQQLLNYTALFKALFSDYYSLQKSYFWIVQLLIAVSTVSGVFWLLSIILGVSHYQNPANTEGFKYLLFSWVFNLPLWQWLLIASGAGILSAWTMYLSIQTGVTSVLNYQKHLSKKCLAIVADENLNHWTKEFNQPPRAVLLRLLRQGVQLTGLVARRITRAFISLIIFVAAFVVLIYLDAKLLVLLVPFALLYIIALYFINRYAARVSTEMADTLPVTMFKFNQLISKVLNRDCNLNSQEFEKEYDESLYMYQAELKYKRRLSEIHVDWLNTLFLVIGIAVIIIYIVYIQTSNQIDWQGLLFFLIALRYASGSLQQISATTVAFSRFLPEIQLVYRLLNIKTNDSDPKLKVTENTIIYIPSNRLGTFEINQLKLFLAVDKTDNIITISEIRERGMVKFFKELVATNAIHIILDNNIERLKQVSNKLSEEVKTFKFIVFSNQQSKILNLSFEDFLNYNPSTIESSSSISSFDDFE